MKLPTKKATAKALSPPAKLHKKGTKHYRATHHPNLFKNSKMLFTDTTNKHSMPSPSACRVPQYLLEGLRDSSL